VCSIFFRIFLVYDCIAMCRDYAAHRRTKMIWVALLLVGRSAFPWLMLSHTAWNSKESGLWGGGGRGGEHCDAGMETARGGSWPPYGQRWWLWWGSFVGSEFQTARRGFVLIVLIFVFI